MKINISCPHDRHPQFNHTVDLPDYKTLARTTIRKMLKLAAVSKVRSIASKVQVRLVQAIPGHVCPHEIDGPIAQKMAEVDHYYVNVFWRNPRQIGNHARELYRIINSR